jgi:5'(3')-deoxyribonucleotidase
MKKGTKKFTICLDMDDTITTLVTAWIRWLNNQYGYNINPEDVTQWEIPPLFPTLTPYEVFEPMWIPEFWDTVQPKNDSVYWVKRLIDDGHDVYICTNTHWKVATLKMEKVLFKYFPYLTNRNLIMMKNKQMIRCYYLVDDGAHNIIGPYKGLLMDMPHNRAFNDDRVTRVHNFKEVYDIITKAAKED